MGNRTEAIQALESIGRFLRMDVPGNIPDSVHEQYETAMAGLREAAEQESEPSGAAIQLLERPTTEDGAMTIVMDFKGGRIAAQAFYQTRRPRERTWVRYTNIAADGSPAMTGLWTEQVSIANVSTGIHLKEPRRTRMCKCPECGATTPFGRREKGSLHLVQCLECYIVFDGENIETWLEGDDHA